MQAERTARTGAWLRGSALLCLCVTALCVPPARTGHDVAPAERHDGASASFNLGQSFVLSPAPTDALIQLAGAPLALQTAMRAGTVGVKTDLSVYPEPRAPPLPPAGGTLTDPVFGTEIMRVTDAADGGNAGTAYSYWPTFNKDDTRLIVGLADGTVRLYEFDPTNFKLGEKTTVPSPPPSTAGYGVTSFEDALWSGGNANNLYVHRGVAVFAYNAVMHKYSKVFDLTNRLPTGAYFFQMSRSIDDDVFAATLRAANYAPIGYIAYRRSTDTLLVNERVAALDEVQVDKSGHYLVVKTGAQGAGAIEVRVIDLATKVITDLTDNGPDYAPGHSDNGSGIVVGGDNWLNRITRRSLARPHTVTTVLSFGDDWGNDFHVSMLGVDENWALISFFGKNKSGLFNHELVVVATDGSGQVRRLAHHYSVFRDYQDTPRANLSRDGRFAAFTSNWGGSPRRDLFILRVPSVALPSPAHATRPRRVATSARPVSR